MIAFSGKICGAIFLSHGVMTSACDSVVTQQSASSSIFISANFLSSF
jgi:hypothetical protein